jgi:MoaA/NifB/PqqE/SkfB family radical SAM enzyme
VFVATAEGDSADRRGCCFSAGTVILLTVTNTCNQLCDHCFRSSRPGRVSSLDLNVLRVALEIAVAELHPDRVVISGGEPTLVPNIVQLIRLVKSLGTRPSLCTNATLVDSAKAWELVAAGVTSATVGIEGVGADYDEFRHSPGGYARATRGIRALVASGVDVTVNVTLHPAILGKATAIAAEVAQLRVGKVSVTFPIMQGRMRNSELSRHAMTSESCFRFAAELRTRVGCPVAVRVPRCDMDTCPSRSSVFSMTSTGTIEGCPDEGSVDAIDTLGHEPRC